MFQALSRFDPWLIIPSVLLVLGGIVTMNILEGSIFAVRHSVWLVIALFVYTASLYFSFSTLKKTKTVTWLYLFSVFLLLLLFVVGTVTQGAQSWFRLWGFSVQPADPAKLILVIVLAKYFTRRHIDIARVKHLFISGTYALVLFLLVALQPDFGSAILIFLIWFGMILIAGVPFRHIIGIFGAGATAFVVMWTFVFKEYQKARITSFLDPLADIQGAGYNAFQSMVAVGSGQLTGKGVGFGTQSKLSFLPEHQTDFIFAAFAEEWGFMGVLLVFSLFLVVCVRLIIIARKQHSNFAALLTFGVLVYFISHITINIGMNIGLLPVTGTVLPFMSYGGSHLVVEFLALGIISALATKRSALKVVQKNLDLYDY
jgi:rod shape determining protein RodA